MPNYDVSVRQDWFLPLVGGAEFNRIKLPNPIIFTSRPYFVDVEDALTTQHYLLNSFNVNYQDSVTSASPAIVTEGTLRTQFQGYNNWAREEVRTTAASITSGTLVVSIKSYTNWAREELKTTTVTVASGTLKVVLLSYTNWAREELKTTTVTVTAGTLT